MFPPRSEGLSGLPFDWKGLARQMLARRAAIVMLLAFAACATASAPLGRGKGETMTWTERAERFELPAPQADALARPIDVWATHYFIPAFHSARPGVSAAIPLLGPDDQPISPALSRRDWCRAALQGTVSLRVGERETTYTFYDDDGPVQADCDDLLGGVSDAVKRATRRARFMAAADPMGCDRRDLPLAPFRTLAVDPKVLPMGVVVFAPELRGRRFTVAGGEWVHDGYLIAGDRGGAVHGAHVDVFTGHEDDPPFAGLVESSPSRTFRVMPVPARDTAVLALMSAMRTACARATVRKA